MHDDSIDLRSYLMGIFDGEGCISGGCDRRTNRWSLQIGVCLASEPVCRLFRSIWGGSCTARRKPSIGGLILWQWQVSGGSGVEFLEFAARHSLVKQAQAIAAIDLAHSIRKYSEKGYRRRVNLHRGERIITDADKVLREQVVRQLRSLNGGRSRFFDQVATTPEPPELADAVEHDPAVEHARQSVLFPLH